MPQHCSVKFATLLACAALHAQQAPYGSISGQVLEGEKEPVRRAIVTLSTVEARPQDAVAWSDDQGRWAFGYLPPGKYQVRAMRRNSGFGYIGQAIPVTLAGGENRAGIVIRQTMPGSISGVIFDEDGKPLAGASVRLLGRGFQRRQEVMMPGMITASGRDGRYRISNLRPGKYTLAVEFGMPVFREKPEVIPGEQLEQVSYGIQYYGGGSTLQSASILEITPGKHIDGADLRLSPKPLSNVEGRVVVPAGVNPAGVMINMFSDEQGFGHSSGGGASPPDYLFRMERLVPGSYTLQAEIPEASKALRATQQLEITGQSISGIVLTLRPGADLAGKVSLEGPPGKDRPTYVSLVPAEISSRRRPMPRASIQPDGTFVLPNVFPGIWDIDVGPIPKGGYLKAMKLGEQDVLTADMVITASTSAPLNIVVSTLGARVSGQVVGSKEEGLRATVLLAPAGKNSGVESFYRVLQTDEQGNWEIEGATPGSYRVFAFEELTGQPAQDPSFLKPFEEHSASVELKEGQNPALSIHRIPATIKVEP